MKAEAPRRLGPARGWASRKDKLIKIGEKVVSHGRYVTFQMAEVAVPGGLFRKILNLIDGLRRPSLAAG